MRDLKLDGPVKAALDTATNNIPNVAYWRDGTDNWFLTNRAHLEYLNSLNLYTIDVDDVISSLELLEVNKVDESLTVLEEVVGDKVTLNDLSDISLQEARPGDVLTWDDDGKIKNFPAPDLQYKNSNVLFATTGLGEDDNFWESFWNGDDDDDDDDDDNTPGSWNIVGKAYVTADCVDKADYKLSVNFVCSVSSNSRNFIFGIFKNNTELEQYTQEFRFDQGYDQKSITIIEILRDVKKGDVISLRCRKGSGKTSTLSVFRRSIILEELR